MKTTTTNVTTKSLVREIREGNVNFDIAIQRGNVWTEEQKSNLVFSILTGYPTGIMYFRSTENGYDAIDGKQRSTAISEFMSDLLSLPDDFETIIHNDEEYDFSGYNFSNLPEWAKDAFSEYLMNICVIDRDASNEQVAQFFFLINNGSSLSTIEKIRVRAISFDDFKEISKHPFIKDITTPKEKAGYGDEVRAQQMLAQIFMKTPDFSKKVFSDFVKDYVVTKSQKEAVIHALDMVYDVYKSLDGKDKEQNRIIKRIRCKIHSVSCVYLAHLVEEAGYGTKELKEIIVKFFTGAGRKATSNNEYNDASSGSTAGATAVSKRKKILENVVNSYISSIEEEVVEEEQPIEDEYNKVMSEPETEDNAEPVVVAEEENKEEVFMAETPKEEVEEAKEDETSNDVEKAEEVVSAESEKENI